MKKIDKGLFLFASIANVVAIVGALTTVEAYRLHKLISGVGDDGKLICSLTGNERTRTYPMLAGKVVIIQTEHEQEYYCAPGKLYWVSK